MAEKEITNTEILDAITELANATAKGFERVERHLKLVDGRLDILDAQYKGLREQINEIPNVIEETYGRMLNDHEDRIRILEKV